jgi:hypothetical protein
MDHEMEEAKKKNELLERQTHHLTSQIFHMIDVNMGYTRKIAELERIVEDKIFLNMHLPPEAGMEIPRDLSPSIRRKLIFLEQQKAILHRRNNLVEELERQAELNRGNSDRQEEIIRTQAEELELRHQEIETCGADIINLKKAIQDLQVHLQDKSDNVDKLSGEVDRLTEIIQHIWNNPLYKSLAWVKRLFTGGRKA